MELPNEIAIPLNADHSTICKFEDSHSGLYEQVRGKILEAVQGRPFTGQHQLPTSSKPRKSVQAKYSNKLVADFRSQAVEQLNQSPWSIQAQKKLDEAYFSNSPSDDRRCEIIVATALYSEGSVSAEIEVTIDFRAFEGDPQDPLITWTIATSSSKFYPGIHNGVVRIKDFSMYPLSEEYLVVWLSPIYSPLVNPKRSESTGSMSSSFRRMDFKEIFFAIAHCLLVDPISTDLTIGVSKFAILDEKLRLDVSVGQHVYREPFTISNDRNSTRFQRAAAFFSRACNKDWDDDSDYINDEPTLSTDRKADVVAIQELLGIHNPELLRDEGSGWDFKSEFDRDVGTQEWAELEQKWAHKVVKAARKNFTWLGNLPSF